MIFYFQLRVVAYDSVYPSNRDTADVTISVTRNERAPIFSLPSYSQTIPDTFSLGQSILDVRATDADGDVVKYEITGGSRALEYYYINPDTGSISLKKPLTEGSQNQDTVSYLPMNMVRSPFSQFFFVWDISFFLKLTIFCVKSLDNR